MSTVVSSSAAAGQRVVPFRLRVWHTMLLVAYVALAVVEIQDQRTADPTLIGLACVGFAGYAVVGGLGWLAARRLASRLGAVPTLALFLVAMAALYLIATGVYLVAERVYFFGCNYRIGVTPPAVVCRRVARLPA